MKICQCVTVEVEKNLKLKFCKKGILQSTSKFTFYNLEYHAIGNVAPSAKFQCTKLQFLQKEPTKLKCLQTFNGTKFCCKEVHILLKHNNYQYIQAPVTNHVLSTIFARFTTFKPLCEFLDYSLYTSVFVLKNQTHQNFCIPY